MRGEILGLERRRFWRDEDKLEIVMSVGIDGATVTQVAQRHEVTRQQIYAWRHELKKKGLWSPDAGALFFLWTCQLRPQCRWHRCQSLRHRRRLRLNCVCVVGAVCILKARSTRLHCRC